MYFQQFCCCLTEDDINKTAIEVTETCDHSGHPQAEAATEADTPHQAPLHWASESSAAAKHRLSAVFADAITKNPEDVLSQPQTLGPSCRTRFPELGDLVMSMGGKKIGHDSKGNKKAFVLLAGQCAQVVDVDEDGDVRLRNILNVQSGWLFRKEFAYVQDQEREEMVAYQTEKEEVASSAKTAKHGAFDVIIQHSEGATVGLRLDTLCERHLEITEVAEDGLICTYNMTVQPEKKVREGYFVIGVGGKTCDRTAMLEHIEHSAALGQLFLRIAPNELIEAALDRIGGPLGLVVLAEPNCKSLLVHRVSVGCVEDYNLTVVPGRRIYDNDRIIEVNGVRGDCKRMLELTRKEGGMLNLVISRPVIDRSESNTTFDKRREQ